MSEQADKDGGQPAQTEGQPGQDEQAGRGEPPRGQAGQPHSPADDFREGLGLLWKAARSTVDEIKGEVNKGGVGDSLKQAGRDLEKAANQAAKALESFVERVGPQGGADAQPPQPPPQGWPVSPDAKPPEAGGDEEAADDDAPAGPGDVRIQIDDD